MDNPIIWLIIISIIFNILKRFFGKEKQRESRPTQPTHIPRQPRPRTVSEEEAPPSPGIHEVKPPLPTTVVGEGEKQYDKPAGWIPEVQEDPQPMIKTEKNSDSLIEKTKSLMENLFGEEIKKGPIPDVEEPIVIPRKGSKVDKREGKKISSKKEYKKPIKKEVKTKIEPEYSIPVLRSSLLQAYLRNPKDLRRAIVINEILGPCKAKDKMRK